MLGDTEKSQQAKQAELRKSLLDLSIAWSLALVCCTHHLGHWLHSLGLHQVAHLPILNTMHNTFSNPAASAALGAVALLGPGRKLLVDGALSLARYTVQHHNLKTTGKLISCTAARCVNYRNEHHDNHMLLPSRHAAVHSSGNMAQAMSLCIQQFCTSCWPSLSLRITRYQSHSESMCFFPLSFQRIGMVSKHKCARA